jgi:hypothetical protein
MSEDQKPSESLIFSEYPARFLRDMGDHPFYKMRPVVSSARTV